MLLQKALPGFSKVKTNITGKIQNFQVVLYEPSTLARHGDERQNAVCQALVISDSLIDQTCGAEGWDKSLSKKRIYQAKISKICHVDKFSRVTEELWERH